MNSLINTYIVPYKIYIYVVAAILVLLAIVFIFRACKSEPKIDLEAIERINKANEVERKKELHEIIVQNAETVRTVDNRTAISETNIIERDRQIRAKVEQADAKIQAAKQQKGDVTAEELEKILLGESK